MQAIILAGGQGTRLRPLVPDLPKCMAPVAGRPFIEYVLDHMADQGVTKVVLALGWGQDAVTARFGGDYNGMALEFSRAMKSLGTGGAIRYALHMIDEPEVVVVNGDSLARVDYARLVAVDGEIIVSLSPRGPGTYVSNGTYVIGAELDLGHAVPLSLEHDVLPAARRRGTAIGQLTQIPFIDIGTPEDYERAQTLLGGPYAG